MKEVEGLNYGGLVSRQVRDWSELLTMGRYDFKSELPPVMKEGVASRWLPLGERIVGVDRWARDNISEIWESR